MLTLIILAALGIKGYSGDIKSTEIEGCLSCRMFVRQAPPSLSHHFSIVAATSFDVAIIRKYVKFYLNLKIS